MSLKRKIDSKFLEWKNDPNRMPLVVKGLRQCGKTYSVLDFARKKLAEHARPWLAVLDVNTAAIGLYRRMGYLPDGVRNMYQPGVDVAFCKPCKELVMRYQPQDQG